MKKLFLSLLLAVGVVTSAAAQNNMIGTHYEIVPAGFWPFCAGNVSSPSNLFCMGYKPGTESYMLLVKFPSAANTGFHYKITGVLANTGTVVTLEGSALRSGNQDRSGTILTFGGIVTQVLSVDIKSFNDAEVIY